MRSLTIAGVLLAAGCARYEYDLVRPAELARHIGKTPERMAIEPLEYRLQSYENRLVMQVRNPSPDPISLLGQESYVVDPDGQSHPLRSQTIGPGSFIKLILPPMEPRVYRDGPRFGVGIGVRARSDYWPYWGYHPYWAYRPFGGYFHPYYSFYGPSAVWYEAWHAPWYDGPYYLADYEDLDPTYWEWHGETEVRLLLKYRHREQSVEHEFVWQRKKT